MKIQFQIRGLNATAGLRAWLDEATRTLAKLIPVSTAEVVLERERDSARPSTHVHLAVPGPDIHATARDHTLEAAWLKVAKNLRQQLTCERRKLQQQLRHRASPASADGQPLSPARRSADWTARSASTPMNKRKGG